MRFASCHDGWNCKWRVVSKDVKWATRCEAELKGLRTCCLAWSIAEVMLKRIMEPLSPLTSLPSSIASTPWPSPQRPYRSKQKSFRRNIQYKRPQFLLSDWHLSQAQHQKTGYRGTNKLNNRRPVFPPNSIPSTRLKLMKDCGYKICRFTGWERRITVYVLCRLKQAL